MNPRSVTLGANELKTCVCLESSLNTLANLLQLHPNDPITIDPLMDAVLAFMEKTKERRPTFDEIDGMLSVANGLLGNKYLRKSHYERFILACPERFMMTYMNNSERTPALICTLRKYELHTLCEVLFPYIHDSKRIIWSQRIWSQRTRQLSECRQTLYPNP